MKIVIKENGKIKHLSIKDEKGIEFIYDLLELYSEVDELEMTQDEFDWWNTYINNWKEDETKIKSLANELNIDECIIRNRIYEETNITMEIEHKVKSLKINEIRKKYIGV